MPKDASLYTKPLPTEAGMLAVARPLHTYCRSASRAFMQIKANDLDPRKASEQGTSKGPPLVVGEVGLGGEGSGARRAAAVFPSRHRPPLEAAAARCGVFWADFGP